MEGMMVGGEEGVSSKEAVCKVISEHGCKQAFEGGAKGVRMLR
jgi:hypothetical protein